MIVGFVFHVSAGAATTLPWSPGPESSSPVAVETDINNNRQSCLDKTSSDVTEVCVSIPADTHTRFALSVSIFSAVSGKDESGVLVLSIRWTHVNSRAL